ncbi:MAG: TAXI family TRAP transporter solute-binding subunit [Proteobacteria bacterium]|nr:TAXI family TRAP transporter solute-binding subunit [Pseudomonadota bacterium]
MIPAMQTEPIVLGTATPGGGFPLYGGVFAETVHAADASLAIETRNTKGSTENLPLLEAGILDLGLVQGEVANPALADPATDLRIIAAMYSSPGMFVVRADTAFRTIADLRGSAVAFGAKGSGLTILGRTVIDGLGLDADRDFGAIYLDRAGDGPAMVLDGRVSALWGAGIGWPGFAAVASSPQGARFIVPDAGEIARILAKHPFLKRLTVAAGSYPGQDRPIDSVGSWSYVLARPGFDAEVAYRLARALHRAEPALAAKLEQARETTAANTLAAAPRPELIHPGVMRYLREAGLAGR